MRVTLADMQPGQEGIIVELGSGWRFRQRLDAMGIRLGAKVTKASGPYMRGPVTVRAGGTHIAMGYRMAQRVVVSVDERPAR